MNFETAVKRSGGEVVGGQLIVRHNDQNLLIGRHEAGVFLPEQTPDAQDFLKGILPQVSDVEDVAPRGRGRNKAKADAPVADAPVADAPVADPDADPADHKLDLTDEVETQDQAD